MGRGLLRIDPGADEPLSQQFRVGQCCPVPTDHRVAEGPQPVLPLFLGQNGRLGQSAQEVVVEVLGIAIELPGLRPEKVRPMNPSASENECWRTGAGSPKTYIIALLRDSPTDSEASLARARICSTLSRLAADGRKGAAPCKSSRVSLACGWRWAPSAASATATASGSSIRTMQSITVCSIEVTLKPPCCPISAGQ